MVEIISFLGVKIFEGIVVLGWVIMIPVKDREHSQRIDLLKWMAGCYWKTKHTVQSLYSNGDV